MSKHKVRKTLLKRFKVTKSGKVLRGKQNSRHRKSHKSKQRIRNYTYRESVPTKLARQILKFIQ